MIPKQPMPFCLTDIDGSTANTNVFIDDKRFEDRKSFTC